MFDVIKEAIKIVREKRQLNRDTRRLQMANLDYAALQNIVNSVANRNVEIEITNRGVDGVAHTLRIMPKAINQINYMSFEEKVAEARSKR